MLALLLVGGLVAAACGGGGSGSDDGDSGASSDEGTPTPGGKIVYALEAENSGGWCLPAAQLAISGIMVARAIYDTLTAPNADGEIVPYLAESVTPNDSFDEWTITLREGVTFHDGTPVDAEAVKLNLDAYRTGGLTSFVFDNISDVQVVDPLTVRVTTATPWPAFPWFLHGSGRFGMVAPAQLADRETCPRNLIGSGPFRLQEWTVNDKLVATKNPEYWQTDEDGVQLPYLDEIEFRPVIESQQRINGLDSDQFNVIMSSDDDVITLRELEEAGDIGLFESDQFAEPAYTMLNTGKPPFNVRECRLALAHGVNREEVNQVRNDGITELANGPYGPGALGYLEDTGFPEYDPEKAAEYADQCRTANGGEFSFTLSSTTDPSTIQLAQLAQEMAQETTGATIDLKQAEQAALINDALASNFQAVLWRNQPGADPDTQYVWWYGGSPVNFNDFDDPEVNRLLDEGRVSTDPAERQAIYEDLNRHFAEEAYNLWAWFTLWGIGSQTDVHGIIGPNLPDGSGPFPGLATGHPTLGIWVEQ